MSFGFYTVGPQIYCFFILLFFSLSFLNSFFSRFLCYAYVSLQMCICQILLMKTMWAIMTNNQFLFIVIYFVFYVVYFYVCIVEWIARSILDKKMFRLHFLCRPDFRFQDHISEEMSSVEDQPKKLILRRHRDCTSLEEVSLINLCYNCHYVFGTFVCLFVENV